MGSVLLVYIRVLGMVAPLSSQLAHQHLRDTIVQPPIQQNFPGRAGSIPLTGTVYSGPSQGPGEQLANHVLAHHLLLVPFLVLGWVGFGGLVEGPEEGVLSSTLEGGLPGLEVHQSPHHTGLGILIVCSYLGLQDASLAPRPVLGHPLLVQPHHWVDLGRG